MRIPYQPRWPLLLALIIGVGTLTALAYLEPRSEAPGEELPAHGGSYVEGVAGAPSRVNPLFATFNAVDSDLSSLVFSGLVRLGPKGDVQPDLAELPKVTPDGKSYAFELRRGLIWHDGEPLDAEDVLFTIDAIQDPEFQGDPVLADVFRDVKTEAPDDHTVIMTLPEPFAPFLSYTAVGILPRHLLSELDAGGLAETPFNQRPIGSGPFRLTDLSDTGATLESFAAYHLGQPRLEKMEIRFYPDDARLLNALLAEEVGGALFRPGMDPEDIALIDSEPRWVRRSLHTTAYSLVYLNLTAPIFEDVEVRHALQQGLDREALIDDLLGGQALPIDSPIIRDLWASTPDPDAYAFDPGRAEELLSDDGWVREESGWVKDGVPLSFVLSSSDDPTQSRVAQEIARQWQELGIQVQVELSGVSQFTEEVLLPREFDAALRTISLPGPDPDPYPFWHSTQAQGEGLNLSGFSDPFADWLLEDARQTSDIAQRAADYRSFQAIFAEGLPAVLLYTPTYQYVVRADLQEVKPGLLFVLSSRFNDVHLWHTETAPNSDEDS